MKTDNLSSLLIQNSPVTYDRSPVIIGKALKSLTQEDLAGCKTAWDVVETARQSASARPRFEVPETVRTLLEQMPAGDPKIAGQLADMSEVWNDGSSHERLKVVMGDRLKYAAEYGINSINDPEGGLRSLLSVGESLANQEMIKRSEMTTYNSSFLSARNNTRPPLSDFFDLGAKALSWMNAREDFAISLLKEACEAWDKLPFNGDAETRLKNAGRDIDVFTIPTRALTGLED